MPSTRRIGGLVLIFGYLGVIAGTVAWAISYWNQPYREGEIFQVALALGIGLAGLACWRWTAASRASDAPATVVRAPTRLMAAAALFLAVGIAASTYETYDNHRQLLQYSHSTTVSYPHYRLIFAGGSAFTVGLLLAAIGFLVLGSTHTGPIDEVRLAVQVDDTTEVQPAP